MSETEQALAAYVRAREKYLELVRTTPEKQFWSILLLSSEEIKSAGTLEQTVWNACNEMIETAKRHAVLWKKDSPAGT